MRALVIGGGIGGVTAALAAPGRDRRRRVRADRKLGLDQRVLDAAGHDAIVRMMRYYDHKGRSFINYDVQEGTRAGGYTIGINRAELLEALAAGLGERLHLGQAFTGFRQDADGVTATFADGT